MNLATVIATICLILVVFLAVRYIVREKRKGSKCVGCPFAEGCSAGHATGSEGRAEEGCGCRENTAHIDSIVHRYKTKTGMGSHEK